MTSRATLTLGRDRYRVGPWHADPETAYLALTPSTSRVREDGLRACVEQLARSGYRSIITSALHVDETGPFLRCGFEEFDRLCVLSVELSGSRADPVVPPGYRMRRARRGDRPVALQVDRRAFPDFWQLDETTLGDAESATPSVRFRVIDAPDGVAAYAITGRSGNQAFLQRLATDPDHQGRGLATALCVDAMVWAHRRCRRLLVNTQVDNERALALYRHLGFQTTPSDLVVLRLILS